MFFEAQSEGATGAADLPEQLGTSCTATGAPVSLHGCGEDWDTIYEEKWLESWKPRQYP